jgi:hypothetical protein
MKKSCKLSQAIFPRMLLAFEAFQLEYRFTTARNPHRHDKYDKDYFIRLLQKMKLANKYVFDYENDKRILPKAASTVQSQVIRNSKKTSCVCSNRVPREIRLIVIVNFIVDVIVVNIIVDVIIVVYIIVDVIIVANIIMTPIVMFIVFIYRKHIIIGSRWFIIG